MLRLVLGLVSGIEPGRLAFHYGPQGKPMLAGDAGTDLEFNLSHSRDRALIAVARGRRVGIDLEAVRPMADLDAIVERFFSEAERAEFRSVPGPARLGAFFRAWGRGSRGPWTTSTSL